MKNIELSTSKFHRLREKTGSLSFPVGAIRPLTLDTKSPRKELEYQWKEERTRIKE